MIRRSHIREVDAIIQVVRCFEDPDGGHVAGTVTPRENQSTAATASAGRTSRPSQRQRRALIQDQPRTWPWPSVSGATKQRSPGQTREASRRPRRSA